MNRESVIALALFLGVVTGAIYGAGKLTEASCLVKWADAPVQAVDWGWFSGCRVQLDSGHWLPSSSVREVNLPRPQR